MNFLWSLLGALLPAAAGMLVLVIGAFCSLFSLDANSQMGPGIGLIFVAAIRLLDRKKRLMLAPRAIAAPNPLQKLAYALKRIRAQTVSAPNPLQKHLYLYKWPRSMSLGLFIMPKRLLGVFLFSNNAIYILRQNGILGRILGKFTYK